LQQQKVGWIYRHQFDEKHEIRVRNYYLWRDFQTFLPIGINNLFDQKYMSNLRLNGFGGRVYEPAPTLNVYGGVSLRLNY